MYLDPRKWSVVDEQSGQVVSVHTGHTPPVAANGQVIYNFDLSGQWLDPSDGEFKSLQEFGEFNKTKFDSDGIDTATLVVPAGTLIQGRDSEGTWTDTVDNSGIYEITTDVPGVIVLKLSRAGYHRKRMLIDAT